MTARRPLTALLAWVSIATCVSGCVNGDQADTGASGRTSPITKADDASILELDLALVDQDGRALRLADLGGHVTVAAMIYSSCTAVCPRVTEDMKALEGQLGRAARADVRFVLFSLDPGRDTPAALRRFSMDHHLDAARWRLLADSGRGRARPGGGVGREVPRGREWRDRALRDDLPHRPSGRRTTSPSGFGTGHQSPDDGARPGA